MGCLKDRGSIKCCTYSGVEEVQSNVGIYLHRHDGLGVTFILGSCVLGETSLVNNYQANPPCLHEYNTLKLYFYQFYFLFMFEGLGESLVWTVWFTCMSSFVSPYSREDSIFPVNTGFPRISCFRDTLSGESSWKMFLPSGNCLFSLFPVLSPSVSLPWI